MTVLDENYLLKMLIEDKDMLSKLSYSCMELITKTEMTAFSENGLFTLLASWAECREHKLCGLKGIFDNVRYELLSIHFIIENVMEVISRDIDLSSYFRGVLQERFRREFGMKEQLPETEENRPRNKKLQTEAVSCFRVTRFFNLINKQRKGVIEVEYLNNVLNCVSNSKDLDLMTQLASTIMSEKVIVNLDMLSKLLGSSKCVDAAKLFISKIAEVKQKTSDFYKIEWTMIKADAILHLLQLYNQNVDDIRDHVKSVFLISKHTDQNYICIIEIALMWSLNNSKTASTEILMKITNEICYKANTNDKGYYSTGVLFPTIKHLFPNTTELKCSHSGECHDGYAAHKWNVNEHFAPLLRLEPFNIGNNTLTLSDKDGLLELTLQHESSKALLLFNRDKPFSPNFPVFFKTLDDEAIRMFVASLGSHEEIGDICYTS